jgi:hypothetical protein
VTGLDPVMRRAVFALAATMIALTANAPSAEAAATRAEYVAQVDQVCREVEPQFQEVRRAFAKALGKGIPGDEVPTRKAIRILNRQIKGMTKALVKGTGVLAGMVERMRAVAPAPGDEALVSQWLTGLAQFASLHAQSLRASLHDKRRKAYRLEKTAFDALGIGFSAVQGFGIAICPTSPESDSLLL